MGKSTASTAIGAATVQLRPLVAKFTTYVKSEMLWWARKELKKAKPPYASSLPEVGSRNKFVQNDLTPNQVISGMQRTARFSTKPGS